MLHNFTSRPLSILGWTIAVLPVFQWNAMILLQMIQNAAASLQQAQESPHYTSLYLSLHWLQVAAHIKFKTLMLAYRTTTCSTLSYFHTLTSLHSVQKPEVRKWATPCDTISEMHKITFQNVMEWPSHPLNASRKTIPLCFHFFFITPCSSFYFSEWCWKHCINSTSCIYCLFMMINRLFLIFKTLRTKASAKWINIYVNVKCSGHIKSKGHIFTFLF